MRAPFSVFKRPSRDRATGKEVVRFVARYFDEEGTVVRTRTLQATNKTAAVLEAKRLLDKGEGIASADPLALDFLLAFWRSDSTYARMKALQGHPLSKGYVSNNAAVISKHLAGPLKGVRLRQLSTSRMERVVLDLSDSGVNPRTLNYLLQAVRVPITDYSRKHRIPDPLQYLPRAAEHPRERGTLSLDEVAKIAALEGESPRVRAAVLLGALCGLRLGEARGLQWQDVDAEAGLLHIRHNWVDTEGAKGPKCGSFRDVPLPAVVLDALELCRAIAPDGVRYVLFSEGNKERPIEKRTIEHGFRALLVKIGIDTDAQKARNLVYHGLRHTAVSMMRASGLPDFAVMRLAGHRSAGMMEHYSHSDRVVDFAQARAALDDAIAAKAAGGEK